MYYNSKGLLLVLNAIPNSDIGREIILYHLRYVKLVLLNGIRFLPGHLHMNVTCNLFANILKLRVLHLTKLSCCEAGALNCVCSFIEVLSELCMFLC